MATLHPVEVVYIVFFVLLVGVGFLVWQSRRQERQHR